MRAIIACQRNACRPWSRESSDLSIADDAGDRTTGSIITTLPNELPGPIHERKPAMLPPDDEALWVDADRGDSEHTHPAVPTPLTR